jgi:transposase-like protein
MCIRTGSSTSFCLIDGQLCRPPESALLFKIARNPVTSDGYAGPAPAPKEETAEQRLSRLERENERLRRENELLRMDREILKKAAAFFAKESE